MDRSARRFLIVDDCPEDAELYRRLLSQDPGHEYVFCLAESGAEGLERCRSEQLDCILLDYDLPDLDGLEFLAELRAEGNLPFVPVVMLTGQGDERIAVEAMKRGCHDYLAKRNITREALYRVTNYAIEKAALDRKLREKEEELRHFAYTAAHDLKSPLLTVSGFCHRLQADFGGQLGGRGEQYIQRVVRGAKRMSQLLDDLLEYARIGRSEKRPEVVDLAVVTEAVLEGLATAIDKVGGRVDVAPLPIVLGDRTGLEQLLQNLIGNALKFCDARSPVVQISCRPAGTKWRITVADNGIGIDPKHHQEIFKPFTRLHPKKREGSGIGLATCRKIVDQHGGEIGVESEPGNGAAFHFTVPRPPESSPAEHCPADDVLRGETAPNGVTCNR